jgi:hypothetical protein
MHWRCQIAEALLLLSLVTLEAGRAEGVRAANKSPGAIVLKCQRQNYSDIEEKPHAWPMSYVTASSLTSSYRRSVRADSLGLAWFNHIPPGAYRIRVDSRADPVEGEAFAADTVAVRGGDTTKVTITLESYSYVTDEGEKGWWRTRTDLGP